MGSRCVPNKAVLWRVLAVHETFGLYHRKATTKRIFIEKEEEKKHDY